MLSKEYLATARTLFREAQTMSDPIVSVQLKALAEDYERRAEKASRTEHWHGRPRAPKLKRALRCEPRSANYQKAQKFEGLPDGMWSR